MGRLRVGDSLDKCMDMGAIVDASQMKSIDKYVQQAKEEGAEVLHRVMILVCYCPVGLPILCMHTRQLQRPFLSTHINN